MIGAAPRVSPAARLDRSRQPALEGLAALVAFRTVAADRDTTPDLRACSAWLRRRLEGMSFATKSVEAGGRPIALLGSRPGHARRSVLVYGHFDVQPAGSPHSWDGQPFRLRRVDGRVAGRGASDNKGPLYAVLLAIDRLVAEGRRLPTLRVWLDAEEEIGSPHRVEVLARHGPTLRSDLVLVLDSPVAPDGRPRIVTSFRGRIGAEVVLAATDARRRHAGLATGVVGDPAARLAHAIATFVDAQGRVHLPGHGSGARPSLVVTSLAAGHIGAVPSGIPDAATATLDLRLPPGEPLEPAAEGLEAHFRAVAELEPPVRSRIRITGVIPGVHLTLDARTRATARAAIRRTWGVDPGHGPSGGSIAAISSMVRAWGTPVLALGLTGLDDGAHGPNESIAVERLDRIEHTVRLLLGGLAG